MIKALRRNCEEFGITFFDLPSGRQGIVHIVGPELGHHPTGNYDRLRRLAHLHAWRLWGNRFRNWNQPGSRRARYPNHGDPQAEVRRINVDGRLAPGVYAKDVILHIIRRLGVNGGLGYAYEYGGSAFDGFTQEERMTVCNMSIEGGARVGYVNPDLTTFDYLKGRPFAPGSEEWSAAVTRWKSFASDRDAAYDDIAAFRTADIAPTVTWGINPGRQSSSMKRCHLPRIFPKRIAPLPKRLSLICT